LNECARPLDENDLEALASGEPAVRPDASSHAAACPRCGAAVRTARALAALLDGSALPAGPAPGVLADRVLRVRPFSRRERRSLAIWSAPLLLLAGLVVSGFGLVAGNASAAGGAGLGAAAFVAVGALARAGLRWALDAAATGPSGLAALAQVLRPTAAGWSALLLLVPAGLGLRRVLSQAAARR
jgi:hypothetical protein